MALVMGVTEATDTEGAIVTDTPSEKELIVVADPVAAELSVAKDAVALRVEVLLPKMLRDAGGEEVMQPEPETILLSVDVLEKPSDAELRPVGVTVSPIENVAAKVTLAVLHPLAAADAAAVLLLVLCVLNVGVARLLVLAVMAPLLECVPTTELLAIYEAEARLLPVSKALAVVDSAPEALPGGPEERVPLREPSGLLGVAAAEVDAKNAVALTVAKELTLPPPPDGVGAIGEGVERSLPVGRSGVADGDFRALLLANTDIEGEAGVGVPVVKALNDAKGALPLPLMVAVDNVEALTAAEVVAPGEPVTSAVAGLLCEELSQGRAVSEYTGVAESALDGVGSGAEGELVGVNRLDGVRSALDDMPPLLSLGRPVVLPKTTPVAEWATEVLTCALAVESVVAVTEGGQDREGSGEEDKDASPVPVE